MHRCESDPDLRFRSVAREFFRALEVRLPQLHQALTGLAHQSFAIQPVLRDVWRAHLLFTDDRLTGLIDLSAAASDHIAVDTARLFRSWFGADPEKRLQSIVQWPVFQRWTQAERHLLSVLDAASVFLSPVTWIRRRVSSREVSGAAAAVAPEWLGRFEEVAVIAQVYEPMPES